MLCKAAEVYSAPKGLRCNFTSFCFVKDQELKVFGNMPELMKLHHMVTFLPGKHVPGSPVQGNLFGLTCSHPDLMKSSHSFF